MKRDPPNETTAAGVHIGSEIWMVNSSASQGPFGLPSVVTFDRKASWGSNSSSAEEEVVEEVEEAAPVTCALLGMCLGPETGTKELAEVLTFLPT